MTNDDIEPACDADPYPLAGLFNAAMAGCEIGNSDEFERDLFLDDDESRFEAMFDTLPEMQEIIHNIYIV